MEITHTHFLCDELVWDGSKSDRLWGIAQQHSNAGLLGLALQRHPLALGLGVLEQTLVLLNATQEILTALAVLDVLDANVDSLGQDLSADSLVDDDADSMGRHIVYTAGLSVVGLVGHTLLDGTVALKSEVNNILSHIIKSNWNLMGASSLLTLMSTMSPILYTFM